MNKYNVGDVCIIDPENRLCISGKSIIYAKILKIKGFWIFKTANVCICDRQGNLRNEDPFDVFIHYLVPNGSRGDNVVIRYPENIPILTKEDFETYRKLYAISINHSSWSEDFKNKCKILLEKIKFFSTIITEY